GRDVLGSSHGCSQFYTVPSTPTPYALSLHDALPIYRDRPPILHALDRIENQIQYTFLQGIPVQRIIGDFFVVAFQSDLAPFQLRSEEHTSELQSRENLVCRLLLEKKKVS